MANDPTKNVINYSSGYSLSEEEKQIGDDLYRQTIFLEDGVNITYAGMPYDLVNSSSKITSFNSICMNTVRSYNTSYGITDYLVYSSAILSLGDLLWTNPNTSTRFNNGLLSLSDCVDYDACLINLKYHTSQASGSAFYCLGFKNKLSCAFNQAVSNNSYGCYRAFTLKDEGVQFEIGKGTGNSSSDANNNALGLPIDIYGVKITEQWIQASIDEKATSFDLNVNKNIQNIAIVVDYSKNT